jgi:hypothetical protein
MEQKNRNDETCCICGYHRTVHRSVNIAGAQRRVCKICAAIGKTLRQSGVEELTAHCLHLFACEVEHVAAHYDLSSLSLPGKYEARLERRLQNGDIRDACGCDACMGVKPDAADFEVGSTEYMILTDLHGLFDCAVEIPGDEMPLYLVRSMKDSERLTHASGEVWRAVDEVARRVVQNAADTRRGPLSPLAERAVPAMPPMRTEAQKNAQDERTRASVRATLEARKAGGYRDRSYFVDAFGECHKMEGWEDE